MNTHKAVPYHIKRNERGKTTGVILASVCAFLTAVCTYTVANGLHPMQQYDRLKQENEVLKHKADSLESIVKSKDTIVSDHTPK